jgi:aspartyl-tRNA(Asn)/glutamyl-tRNA(Gln) amidotransferase subunit A
MPQEEWQKSAVELSVAYADKETSPVEVLESILDRIARINPRVNAFVTLDLDGAREAAKQSEERWQRGHPLSPLDGVPISIKDNILVRGLRATWGSKLYADFVPEADELTISRLRAAGAISLGKTNCPEFTLQGYTDNLLFGPTRNPWDLALTPGGSSGGAVAAVAAGLGPIAIATDGGGSIRRPASHTGLVGLKPSRGRVPRSDGFPAILLDLEAIGPIARTVADVVLTMQAISESDARDPLSFAWKDRPFCVEKVQRSRILLVPQFSGSPVDPEIAAKVKAAATVLSNLGHVVEEGDAPFAIEPLAQAWSVITEVGLAWLLESHSDWAGRISTALEQMAIRGMARAGTDYLDAINTVTILRQSLSIFFSDHDLIMTPTAAALPWPAAEPFPPIIDGKQVGPRAHAVFTGFANMAGSPGISVPTKPSANGLPIGFQLVAAPGGDALLCALADQFEAACPWVELRPPL